MSPERGTGIRILSTREDTDVSTLYGMPSVRLIGAIRDTSIGAPDTRVIIRCAVTIITILTIIAIHIVTTTRGTDCAGNFIGLHVRGRRLLPASAGSAAGDTRRGKR
jgi:hypothetical protein